MTDVIISPRIEDPLSDTETVITGGWLQIRPTSPYIVGTQWVLDVFGPAIPINGLPVPVKLDPLADISYELLMNVPDGRGGRIQKSDYRMITDEASPTPWEAFVKVGPPGSTPADPSDFDARLDALEAANPSGGASDVSEIAGISAFAITYLDDTSAGAVLTTLGAAPAGAAVDTAVVHDTGDETVGGIKTFASSPIVPTPTTGTQAANKDYADSVASSGTPDADASTKGKVQLAGDLAGTAAAPSVAKVKGITVSATAPTTGQVLTATSTSAAQWSSPTTGTVIDEIDDVPGLTAALAAKVATGFAGRPPWSKIVVMKDLATGFWPASWSGENPVYTAGSASAGVRPTSRADIICEWVGADPSPAVVTSGAGGLRQDLDQRFVY